MGQQEATLKQTPSSPLLTTSCNSTKSKKVIPSNKRIMSFAAKIASLNSITKQKPVGDDNDDNNDDDDDTKILQFFGRHVSERSINMVLEGYGDEEENDQYDQNKDEQEYSIRMEFSCNIEEPEYSICPSNMPCDDVENNEARRNHKSDSLRSLSKMNSKRLITFLEEYQNSFALSYNHNN